MANKIKPKRSYTTNAVPTAADLEAHELAINWADGKAYTKNASGQIVSLTMGGGGGSSGFSWAAAPESPTDNATAGQIAYDADYLYVATATNTWKRTALTSWSVGPVDPNFSDVSLLLHMDGSNGASTFTDSSSNSLSITRNGNAQVSTVQSKFGGASLLVDGSADSISLPSSSTPLNVGSGNFTIELWVRAATIKSAGIFKRYDSSTSTGLYMTSGGEIAWWADGTTGQILLSTTALSTNTWHFVAVTRSGTSLKLWIDGVEKSSTTNSSSYDFSTFHIGRSFYDGDFDGYIDDFRLTKGVARYTANFTPPTAAFPDA